jgi:hypothetical protein
MAICICDCQRRRSLSPVQRLFTNATSELPLRLLRNAYPPGVSAVSITKHGPRGLPVGATLTAATFCVVQHCFVAATEWLPLSRLVWNASRRPYSGASKNPRYFYWPFIAQCTWISSSSPLRAFSIALA